ncbi:MAG: hypothetical protein Q9217_003697 [Psora testacea]
MALPVAAPALATSSIQLFENDFNTSLATYHSVLSDEQLYITYEIQRTISEIKRKRYKRVALQFPDNMLQHAPRVFEALRTGLVSNTQNRRSDNVIASDDVLAQQTQGLSIAEQTTEIRLYILGDTSYGACCVDEIAAEHVNADAVVHYGRTCLSPTARLSVIYVFTVQPLPNLPKLLEDFEDFYGDKDMNIILMADVTYQYHLHDIVLALQDRGYSNLYEANVKSDPSSPLPNRTVPAEVSSEPLKLKEWQLFHISDPPKSLLLNLSSRVANISIHPAHSSTSSQTEKPFVAQTARSLNRRYALLTSVNTVSIFGILINTLSVKNYLNMVDHVKNQISASGKKSYTFVVGKLNAAKVANFDEIGAWIVIGCWESSLIDSKDFWKPVITPFELEVLLTEDNKRVWNGDWNSDYQTLLNSSRDPAVQADSGTATNGGSPYDDVGDDIDRDYDSEPESAPPEYDLRTGRYVSNSRPLQSSYKPAANGGSDLKYRSNVLLRPARGDAAVVGGTISPAAEYLRTQRIWKGLGSDFEVAYEGAGTFVEEGRTGIARGYTQRGAEAKV